MTAPVGVSPSSEPREAITFRCWTCNEILLSHAYDAPRLPVTAPSDDRHLPIFPTLSGSKEAAEIFNEHEHNR